MKKLALAVLAAVLLLAGPALADPYPATVATTTKASGDDVRKGKAPRTHVRVTAGNTEPKGKLHLSYERVKGGFAAEKTVKYAGGKVTVTGPKLEKAGKYKVVVRYVPKPDSVWKPSKDSYTFKVVKR